jgi:hypothetical protein
VDVLAGQENTRIHLHVSHYKMQNTRIHLHVSHTLVTGSGAVPLRHCNRAATELQQRYYYARLQLPSCFWYRRSGVVTLEIFFFCCSGQAVALFRGRDLALGCGHGLPPRAGALSSLLMTQEHLQERVGAVA